MEKYDIFISYSHDDNTDNGNWIHVFCDEFAKKFRTKSGIKPKIFLDKVGLGTGDVLDGKIVEALDQSLLFIPVLSPGYLASKWCRKEFLYFMDTHEKEDVLILDNKCRIAPIRIVPYENFKTQSGTETDIKRIRDFLSRKDILYKDFYRDPLPMPTNDDSFQDEVAKLTDDLGSKIAELPELIRKKKNRANPATPAIYLGYAFGDGTPALALREGLLREWEKQQKYGKFNHRILPDSAPNAADFPRNKPEAELRAFIQQQLEQSDYAILVFDDVEGAKTTDTKVPVAHLQYRLALEESRKRPDFRLLVAAQTTDDCATSQLEFILEILKDAQANERVLLVGFEVKVIRDFLHDLIHAPTPVPPPSAEARLAFYIHDRRDRGDELHDNIDDVIFNQKYDVLRPVFREDDPLVDPDDYFRKFWLQSGRAIVLLRHGTTAWCNSVKVELLKLRTEKTVPGLMAICVTDPDAGQRLREVRSHEFMVIDCTKPNFQEQIVNFLNNAGHA